MSKQQTVANILKRLEERRPLLFENYSPAILRLHRIHSHLHQNLEQIIGKYDLQHADFGVLATLHRESLSGCLSPTEIYCSLLFSSGGLTKVLNRVTKAGLVERIDNPQDKRSKLVKLTGQGKILIVKIMQELHSSEQKKMVVLSDQEKQQLNTLLAKFLSAWE